MARLLYQIIMYNDHSNYYPQLELPFTHINKREHVMTLH